MQPENARHDRITTRRIRQDNFGSAPPVFEYRALWRIVPSFGCRFSNFFSWNLSRCRDRFRYDASMCRFAAFSAKRDGRQIWAIGLDHEFPERDLCRDFSHSCAVLESDNSSERNDMLQVEHFVRLIQRAAKAMKNATHF